MKVTQKQFDILFKLGIFAVAGVAAWLILRKLGLTKTAVEKEGEKNIADIYNRVEVEIQKQGATLSDAELRSVAASIKNSWGFLNDDEEKIYSSFSRLNNLNDLLLVIRYYGTYKGEGLEDSISSRMNAREVNKINEILANKGINFSF